MPYRRELREWTSSSVAWLSQNEIVKLSARYGKKFGVDPLVVAQDGGDEFLMMFRAACMEVIGRDEKEEEARAKRK